MGLKTPMYNGEMQTSRNLVSLQLMKQCRSPARLRPAVIWRAGSSKCPELNPTENIWQFMRENCLSNRVFRSFDDIVDCCDA
jgi:hypothetical protein